MGSGKTTLGKKLALLNRRPFSDLDVFIEQQEKKSVPAIFEEEGETVFRQKESYWLNVILEREQPQVVSLGGGTVCFDDNLAKIKKCGLLIYIELSVATLTDRLVNARTERPLFKGLSASEFPSRIKELLDQRAVYYRQAHLTVSGLNLTPKQLQQHILDFTKK